MTMKSIRKIYQKNNHEFTIEWNDGFHADYRLSDIQRQCPCANCVDETTGKRFPHGSHTNHDVRAVKIMNVGRYALKIQFTSGCSSGIYGLDFLYLTAKKGSQ